MKIAVQLYTLREDLKHDFEGTLKEVAALGYDAVEFAGFYGRSAEEVKALLEALNLEVIGAHTGFDELLNDLDETIQFNRAIGNPNLVIPYIEFPSKDAFEEIVSRIKAIDEKVRKAGLKLHYHNHQHELVEVEGKTWLERLFEALPDVYAEIDTYWVSYAGIDPADYLKKYEGRLDLIHLKDAVRQADGKVHPAPLGTGEIDLKRIVDSAKALGVKALIVENDHPKDGGIKDIATSINHLKTII